MEWYLLRQDAQILGTDPLLLYMAGPHWRGVAASLRLVDQKRAELSKD